MIDSRFFEDLASKFSALVANSPAKDIDKNARAFLSSALGRLDLVPREEFEVQKALLARAQERLAQLEAQLAALEQAQKKST